MNVVHAPKKKEKGFTIKVGPAVSRGRFGLHGKAGKHKDKRRKSRVNDKDWSEES